VPGVRPLTCHAGYGTCKWPGFDEIAKASVRGDAGLVPRPVLALAFRVPQVALAVEHVATGRPVLTDSVLLTQL
jgi:hypothetical protein